MLKIDNRPQLDATINTPGDFMARLNGGAYKMPVNAYPREPVEPEVLRKRVNELTDEEIQSLYAVKTEYEGAQQAFDLDVFEYNELERKLLDAFWRDIQAYHRMTDHEKAAKVRGLAWEYGHSSGVSDVAYHYNNFVGLVR